MLNKTGPKIDIFFAHGTKIGCQIL